MQGESKITQYTNDAIRNFWINRERSLDMKVKISEYTPYLLVGLLIVVIARHFYNPLQLVDMWEVVQEGEEMSMPIPVMEGIINVFCPALMSAMEFEGYLASIIEAAGNSSFVGALVAELVCLGYIVITYLLEKIHAYWHEEGVFAMCVDMLCIGASCEISIADFP